jgi:hypothetical protein
MKHLRVFTSEEEYKAYRESADFQPPNVSLIIPTKEVNFKSLKYINFLATDGIFCASDGEFLVIDK